MGLKEVKTIGDGFLLTAADPSAALEFAGQALAEMSGRDRQLGLRLGIHAGPVVKRDGDVFGRTVNLAARVLAQAGDGEALATGDALTGARIPERSRVEAVGRRRLRGIPRAVELHSLRPTAAAARVTDPVCQMRLHAAAALACVVGRDTFYFCSDACRSSFLEAAGMADSRSNRGPCLLAPRKRRKRRSAPTRVVVEWR